jgi:hypothetical protein
LVASQYGVLLRAQAVASGMSSAAIGRRLASGAWVRCLPGVFRIASVPPSWYQRLVAVWLWAGLGAVVSHRAAAVLLRLGRFKFTGYELWIPRARQPPNKLTTLHFTRGIPETDLRKGGPLPVTNPTRPF